MVVGVDKFRQHFAGHEDEYVLIGGAACDLIFEDAGLSFRATKDLDVVLCVEVLGTDLAHKFRAFIKNGGYEARERSDGHKEFYRFHRPRDTSYPHMVELFSRRPVDLPRELNVNKVRVDQGILSLSALLLDDSYYNAVQEHKVVRAGISLLDQDLLIPFKAKAFLDLRKRRNEGETVDENDIRKHKKDVFRLAQLLIEERPIDLPEPIRCDLRAYLDVISADEAFDPRMFHVTLTKYEGIDLLRKVYKL